MTVNKKNKLKYSLLALAFLGAVSCTPKKSHHNLKTDELRVDQEKVSNLNLYNQSEYQRLKALYLQTSSILEVQNKVKSSHVSVDSLINKVISPLSEILLSTDYMLNPKITFTNYRAGFEIMPRLSENLNKAILLLNSSDKNNSKIKSILAQYKSVLLWDCDSNLRGSCYMLKTFKRYDNTYLSDVVKLMYKDAKSEAEKNQLIKVAFTVKNSHLDRELRLMLLERIATEYYQKGQKQVDKETLRRNSEIFANVLNIDPEILNSKDRYKALFSSVNVWTLSRNNDEVTTPAISPIMRFATKNLLYDGSSLNQDLKKELNNIAYKVGDSYEFGFQFQLDNLKGLWKKRSEEESIKFASVLKNIDKKDGLVLFNDTSNKVSSNLLKDAKISQDEYLYLTHKLFYGHFNLEDSESFWQGTLKDEKAFLTTATNFLKLQVAHNIVLANTMMSNFYNKNKNTKLINLLRESESEASKIRKSWSILLGRAKTLKIFVNRISQSKSNKNLKENLVTNIDVLQNNIKYLVTYPNMLSLLHLMAKLELKDEVQSFFGKFTIDSDTVITQFFNGKFMPWFNFGHNGITLDKYEIIYTFYYALTTEIFSTFSNNEAVNFSTEDFLKVVVKKLLLKNEKSIEQRSINLNKLLTSSANYIMSAKNACTEEQSITSRPMTLTTQKIENNSTWFIEYKNSIPQRSETINQIPFTSLGASIYDYTNDSTDKPGLFFKEFRAEIVKRNFKEIRTEFAKSIATTNVIFNIISAVRPEDKEKYQKILKEQLSTFNGFIDDYITNYLTVHNKLKGCEIAFAKRHREIRYSIILREVKYLQDYFDQIENMYQSTKEIEQQATTFTTFERLEGIRKNMNSFTQSQFFPKSYRSQHGYSQIDLDHIVVYEMDTFARVKSFLEEMYPNQYSITAPASFETSSVFSKSNSRIIHFNRDLKDRDKARKQFVQAGINAFIDYMDWANKPLETDNLEAYGKLLIEMYKSKNNLPELSCKDKCQHVTANDILEHFDDYLQFLNIDEMDKTILQLTEKEFIYGDNVYEEVLKRKNSHSIYNYYDLVLKMIFSDQDATGAQNTWFKTDINNYVTSVHKRMNATYIFPFPQEIEDIERTQYTKWVTKYLDNVVEFVTALKSRSNLNHGINEFSYRLNSKHYFESSSELNTLASDLMIKKLIGFINEVNDETSQMFNDEISEKKKEVIKALNSDKE